MDKMIYIAMSGAKQNMAAQAVHANNLANVSTTGFRADFVQALTASSSSDEGHQSRAYSVTADAITSLREGTPMETGGELDIAIKGKGFIAVQAPDGSEAYTRAGDLQLDATGRLLTGGGLPVMGNGSPISIPPSEKIAIGEDGTITVRGAGQSADTLTVVDRIKLVKLDPADVKKGPDGLLRTVSGTAAVADASITIESGFLEGSNVNAIEELTQIISLSRQYEMQIKMMHTAKQADESTARILQVS